MIVFTWIWQAVMVCLAAMCVVLLTICFLDGDAFHGWVFAVNTLTFSVYAVVGWLWRSTHRSLASTAKIYRSIR